MIHDVLMAWDMLMDIGSIIGTLVLIYGIELWPFMIWDKVVHGQPFIEEVS